LFFVCNALRTCCSKCDFMKHTIFLLRAGRVMISQLVVKEPYILSHKYNFDTREDTTDAMIISARRLELNSLNGS
jgi:hypothetical protein